MSDWIIVNDILPENDDRVKKHIDKEIEFLSVIAYGKMKGGFGKIVKETNRYVRHKTGIEYLDSIEVKEFDKWYWADCWEEVTHWMPLPEPPKE